MGIMAPSITEFLLLRHRKLLHHSYSPLMKMFVIRMANHPFPPFSCLVATVITFITYLSITWSCMPMETSCILAAVFVLNLLAICTIHDRYPSMWRFRQCNTPLPLSNLAKGKTSLNFWTRKLKPLPMPHLKITHFH